MVEGTLKEFSEKKEFRFTGQENGGDWSNIVKYVIAVATILEKEQGSLEYPSMAN